mmetsp:Transcript_1413/g.1945  ORF Transcript_1413/g.1945 Transcript_1413/m.1945 type:complete len:165 (-) Transcript_1413:708-1202(-)
MAAEGDWLSLFVNEDSSKTKSLLGEHHVQEISNLFETKSLEKGKPRPFPRSGSPVPSEKSLRRVEGVVAGMKRPRASEKAHVDFCGPANLVGDREEFKEKSELGEDVDALLELKDQDRKLESQQTCHRCGKRGKGQDKISCKNVFCSLSGKKYCICEGSHIHNV